MKGNFISSNTWNAVKVNDTDVSLPNLEFKKYNLLDSEKSNFDFSCENKLFSKEVYDKLRPFTNLELNFISKKENALDKIVSLKLDKENNQLVDIIKVHAKEGSNLNLTLDYFSDSETKGFRNSIIEVIADKNSNIKLFISQRFSLDILSIQSVYIDARENSNVEVVQIDLGSLENYVSYTTDMRGESSNVDVKSIYFGEKNQKLDFNYNTNQIAPLSNYDIFVKGALAGKAEKICKLSIDFKRGSSKSKGSEEEYVTLLSDDIKNVAVPILLCTEDDVEGVHASSSGKIDDEILFYIMSRGFSMSEAKMLILESQFAQTVDLIENKDMKKKIYESLRLKLSNV